MGNSYTIARLSAAADVHIETIRYYQRRGLIPLPERPLGGVRRYTDDDAERLRFIKRAQAMGFTLVEVGNLLRLRDRQSCSATRELAIAKLRSLDARLCELQHLRKELSTLIARCDANTVETTCPVVDRLASKA
jgi:MerR family mercuric resistance operon transcriptional regulator